VAGFTAAASLLKEAFVFMLPDNQKNVRQSINGMKLGVSDVHREGHKIMSTLVHG
jgi:hypothetical protein